MISEATKRTDCAAQESKWILLNGGRVRAAWCWSRRVSVSIGGSVRWQSSGASRSFAMRVSIALIMLYRSMRRKGMISYRGEATTLLSPYQPSRALFANLTVEFISFPFLNKVPYLTLACFHLDLYLHAKVEYGTLTYLIT